MSVNDKLKYVQEYQFPYCNDLSKYETVLKIGEGTYGEVFKAKAKVNDEIFVAVKRVIINNGKEGFPLNVLREIKILQALKHKNVVNLIEICSKSDLLQKHASTNFYLIFEFCDHDLSGLLNNKKLQFPLAVIKKIMQQLLNGLYFIHFSKILHRDIKPANTLLTKDGILKLADFGLSRAFSTSKIDKPNNFSHTVVTLWYRSPELLLGDKNYGPPIDLWSCGCILYELCSRFIAMPGNTEQGQLKLISKLCGSITTKVWPDVENCPLFKAMNLPKRFPRMVKGKLREYQKDPHASDLLDKLLTLDPTKRYDADSALNHKFFWTDPMPCDLKVWLSQLDQSMFDYTEKEKHLKDRLHLQHHVPSRRVNNSMEDSGFQDHIF